MTEKAVARSKRQIDSPVRNPPYILLFEPASYHTKYSSHSLSSTDIFSQLSSHGKSRNQDLFRPPFPSVPLIELACRNQPQPPQPCIQPPPVAVRRRGPQLHRQWSFCRHPPALRSPTTKVAHNVTLALEAPATHLLSSECVLFPNETNQPLERPS